MSFEESQQRHKSANRNDACPCGSGRKYKKCHWAEDETAIHAELKLREEAAKAALDEENAKAEAEGTSTEGTGKAAIKNRGQSMSSLAAKGRAQARPTNLPRRGAV
ncbi:MAG: SEC-C domain-containing protein [Polyangiaceae bacterium]|nr:SEC-C domain-containing protein [Polyangiaceae bacterium]